MEKDYEELLKRPLWQMTGEDLIELLKTNTETREEKEKKQYAYGLRALGDELGCSQSTVFDLRKRGILDEAIVSYLGKRIVFNVEKARELSNKYKAEQSRK